MAEERVQRRLAAILAVDVVDYSRLMEADEEGTRARGNAHLNELIMPAIFLGGGRIVKTTDGGLLVEFAKVVDAVESAVEIQKGMAERNAKEPADRRIEFRIGVNLGDTLIEGDDLHGDGPNLSAHLEGLAGQDSIFITGAAFDQIHENVDIRYEFLGEQEVENIADPVRVYRVLTGPEDVGIIKKILKIILREILSRIPFIKQFEDKIIYFIMPKIRISNTITAFVFIFVILIPVIGIVSAKVYQRLDDDPERGAVAMAEGAFGESYDVPEYLNQGWDEADSLWFYNTTQGSALLPYDFLLALEQRDLEKTVECERNGGKAAWFLCDKNVDRFRYLPQKATLFNPDALPVGFVKEYYQGKDYVGYTCAACHTAQINFRNPGEDTARALRIDGGPAMADMVGFLTELARAMKLTLRKADEENPRLKRFVDRVLELNNDYGNAAEIERDLKKWTNLLVLHNTINHSTFRQEKVAYGYARLDAFGRIYNRVLQHVINREQVAKELRSVTVDGDSEQRLLSNAEINKVLQNVGKPGNIILRDDEFWEFISNLQSDEYGFPGLTNNQMLRVRNKIFNSPNAPVSYPFLWDITHSDYVQWNGLASNNGTGPLERNVGKVFGAFGILDWQEDNNWTTINVSAWLSGQYSKRKQIYFKSSIDLFNLYRLESHLTSLKSPRWPFCRKETIENGSTVVEYYLPTGLIDGPVDLRDCNSDDKKIDEEMADKGQLIYAKRCQRCHGLIVRDAWDRLIVSKMLKIAKVGTDEAMARNIVGRKGKSGNFNETYQEIGIGRVVIEEDAPVALMVAAVTKGVVGTADPDKMFFTRWVERAYIYAAAYIENPIKSTVKSGNYDPDTIARPYNSLLAYRARSLNGIWATAPYLHNGSVPTLYDLLLPARRSGDIEGENGRCNKYRPDAFMVGAREFDPQNVGFKSEGYEGFIFSTTIRGNRNTGHEYGACAMIDEDRWYLIEYLKSL